MANEEHLAILKQGVEVWNEWMDENIPTDIELAAANLRGEKPNLPDFSKADLKGMNLAGADFRLTNFSEANLENVNLVGANLSEADLSGANLSGVNFSKANISEADLSETDLSKANLNGANLFSASLREVSLRGVNLYGASLKRVNLRETYNGRWNMVHEVDFTGAILSGVDLSGLDLSGLNFSGFSLDGADLSGADLREANLSRADLRGADLSEANLSRADLRGADFSAVLFGKFNFGGTKLSGVNLIGANLTEANLSGANLSLSQAVQADFTSAKLTGACLENWNIDTDTNLDNVICDYVYLRLGQKERRPSSGNFKPGEFTKLFQKVLETIDLIFADGIDWKAFLLSFQELRDKYGDENLSVQAIEKKSGGAFVIRLDVPLEANKAEIERQAKELYELKLNLLKEKYRAELQAKDREIAIYLHHNACLENIISTLAIRPIQIDISAKAESNSMSKDSKKQSNFNLQGAQFGGGLVDAETVNVHQIGGNITNYTSQQQQNPELVKTILILAANPKTTSRLRLDEEVREIDAGLQRAKKRELFDLKQRWAVRVHDVYQSLLDFKPQIVHFSGHGAGDDGLQLEDETGKMRLVDTVALAELFKLFAGNIECVILNACYSEVQAIAIAQHIPYVIGMKKAIGDKAAIKFATGFYSALGTGESVEFAYKLGCNVIQLDGIPEHLTPVLKKK